MDTDNTDFYDLHSFFIILFLFRLIFVLFSCLFVLFVVKLKLIFIDLLKIMFIDSHLHINFNDYSLEKIISYLDKNKIDQCWLLTWEEINHSKCDNPYIHLSIEDVFEAYQKYPSRIIPMYAPDPNRIDVCEILKSYYKKGIKGCGELKVSLNWNSDKINILLKCINILGIPLIFHMENKRYFEVPPIYSNYEQFLLRFSNTKHLLGFPKKIASIFEILFNRPLVKQKKNIQYLFPGYLLDFASLETRLQEYPNIKFIGHGPFLWKGISSDFAFTPSMSPQTPIVEKGIISILLEEYDNFFIDLSAGSGYNALTRDPDFTKRFLNKYYNKILYGTDNFSLGLKEFLDSLKLSKNKYKMIYGDGENAYNILSS